MEKQIEVSKAIITRFFRYSEVNTLDDESEFFPILKTIIVGASDSCGSAAEAQQMKKHLRVYAKQLYASRWIGHVKEDGDDELDLEAEKTEAEVYFERIYKRVR